VIDRERRAASLFFIGLGGLGLLATFISLITLSAPPPTSSLFRSGFASILEFAFGVPGGYVAFHLAFGVVSASMVWLGIRLRRT